MRGHGIRAFGGKDVFLPGGAAPTEAGSMSRPRLRKRVYAIGGKPLLTVHSDSLLAFNALDIQPLDDPLSALSPGAVEIFLLGGAIAEQARVEIPEPAETVFTGDTVTIFSHGGRHYGSWYGKAASVADSGTGRAIIRIPGLRHYNPDFVARFVFRPVLDRMLFDYGWLPLHAAAVTDGRDGFLLAGGTGSGKTTLLLRLLEEGMGFLADDRALVRGEGDRFRIHAFPEKIRPARSDGKPKRSLMAPDDGPRIAEAGMILFLDPDRSGRPRAEFAGVAEAAARLSQSVSPHLGQGERREILFPIERLCRTVERRVIRGWGAPEERAALITRILKEKRTT
jgi:hypothetical protein